MTEPVCAVPLDTKLETPEGPLTAATVMKTPTSVMTRTNDGKVRFAMTGQAKKSEGGRPAIRITLANGRTLRVGGEQILFRRGMLEVRAREVKVGDELESVFVFPEGYEYRTDDGREVRSSGAVAVSAVDAAGEADVCSFRVHLTGRFVFGAGVLGRAEGLLGEDGSTPEA
jgi:hypothetical protein